MAKYLHNVSPFRWIALLWVGFVYIWGIQLGGVVREQISGRNIFFFTIFMILHFGLYCMRIFLPSPGKWYRFMYYIVQALLIFLLSLISHRLSVTLALYLPLIGEITSVFQKIQQVAVMAITCLLLFSCDIVLLYGWEYARVTLLFVCPISLTVVGYVHLFLREARAHSRTQVLLQELEIAHKQLASYSVRIEELTRATERRRMARELHDTLAQGLAGLILQLEAVKSHLVDQHHERALEIVIQAMGRARASLTNARHAIDNLRTETITPAMLQQAIEGEIDHFTAATGIPCIIHLSSLSSVPASLCEYMQRIIAEGLTNVARHAQAHQVWVSVAKNDGMFEIEVRDDGIGFDLTLAAQQGHYGLLGLRERARLLGGRFILKSASDVGTTLRLLLPENNEGNIT